MKATEKCPTHHSTGRCAMKPRSAGEFKRSASNGTSQNSAVPRDTLPDLRLPPRRSMRLAALHGVLLYVAVRRGACLVLDMRSFCNRNLALNRATQSSRP
jgi:hypothetical protein